MRCRPSVVLACATLAAMGKRGAGMVLTLFLAACGAATPPPTRIGDAARLERCPPVASDAESPFLALEMCLEDDSVAAARALSAILRTELEGGELRGAYADGGERVWSRSAVAEPAVTLSPEEVAVVADARRRAFGEPESDAEPLPVGFRSLQVRSEGDVWALDGEVMVLPTLDDAERSGVEAVLRRTTGGWLVTRLRTWPLEWSTQDEHETYDEALWARLDARAERAREGLDASDSETRRLLVEALQAAHRYAEAREALAPLLAEPNRLDVSALADVEAALGHPELAAAARTRLEDEELPPSSLASWLRQMCRAPLSPEDNARPEQAQAILEEDPDHYYEMWERCDARALVSSGTREQPLGLARIVRGAEERETTEFFFWDDGVWSEGVEVSDGPFNGNQTTGVLSFEVSDGEALAMDGMTALRAQYRRERVADDVRTRDEGVLVCVRERSACLLLPESVSSTDAEGAETVRAYEVRFSGETLSRRRTSGPEPDRELVGERALGAWFDRD